MFASKLLGILEALPTDEEHGDRVVPDTTEEKSTMKENPEADSSAFPTKDILDLNVNVDCNEKLGCETKDMDELWKVSELDESVISDDVSRSNDSEVRASTVEVDLNEALPKTITSRRYGDAFERDVKDGDEKWNTPEFEFSIIPDLIDEKGNESVVDDARFTSGYKFFETDTKGVEEYELPEMVVFYKESSWNNAQPGTYVSVPDDEDQHSNTTESDDTELPSADGSKSSVESENNEAEDTKLPIPNALKPGSPEEVYNDDDSEDNYLEDTKLSVPNDLKSGSPEEVYNDDDSEDTYLEDTKLPIPNDLKPGSPEKVYNDDDTEDNYLEDTKLSIPNDLKPGSPEEVYNDDDSEDNYLEDTKLSIPNDLKPGSPEEVHNDDDSEDTYLEDTKLPIPNDLKPGSPEEVYNDDDSEDINYLEDLVMIFGSKGTPKWKHSNKQPDIGSSANVTPRREVSKQPDQNPFEEEATDLFHHSELGTGPIVRKVNSTKTASARNLDQGVEKFPKLSRDVPNLGKSLRDFLFDSQGYLADEEASLSSLRRGAGPIIYSRRISSLERISVGSDDSTNSGGSFAFPILQSERYSSPVRMTQEVQEEVEEEETNCQKRGWTPVFVCCKF